MVFALMETNGVHKSMDTRSTELSSSEILNYKSLSYVEVVIEGQRS